MPSVFYFVTATVSKKYITLFRFQEKNVGREAKKGKGKKKEKGIPKDLVAVSRINTLF